MPSIEMAIPDTWHHHRDIHTLCLVLNVTRTAWTRGLAESKYNYIEKTRQDRRTGKPRDLCYPRPESFLQRIQAAIKDRILVRFDLVSPIKGYLKGYHNINVGAVVCVRKYVGIFDIRKYHPSITTRHVAVALKKHGLLWELARQLARLVTYRGTVPQGAPTSNHIANIVLDSIMRRTICPF